MDEQLPATLSLKYLGEPYPLQEKMAAVLLNIEHAWGEASHD
jgi:hypothetical protein